MANIAFSYNANESYYNRFRIVFISVPNWKLYFCFSKFSIFESAMMILKFSLSNCRVGNTKKKKIEKENVPFGYTKDIWRLLLALHNSDVHLITRLYFESCLNLR